VTDDLTFDEWANLDPQDKLADFRKDIVIELHDAQGVLVRSWLVRRCLVSEYAILDGYDSHDRPRAVERITLENEGWEWTAGP
jgi:phage tail-like protein